jgi:hypothetical protein
MGLTQIANNNTPTIPEITPANGGAPLAKAMPRRQRY